MNPHNVDDAIVQSLQLLRLVTYASTCHRSMHPLKEFPILHSTSPRDCQWTVAGNILIILLALYALVTGTRAIKALLHRLLKKIPRQSRK